MALDAHDRQDNDGGGLVGSIRTPEAYDAPIVGKLDNVAHVGGPAICPLPARQRTPQARCKHHVVASKRYAGLTLR